MMLLAKMIYNVNQIWFPRFALAMAILSVVGMVGFFFTMIGAGLVTHIFYSDDYTEDMNPLLVFCRGIWLPILGLIVLVFILFDDWAKRKLGIKDADSIQQENSQIDSLKCDSD